MLEATPPRPRTLSPHLSFLPRSRFDRFNEISGYSIDPPECMEIDDAFWVENLGDSWYYIHTALANPAMSLDPHGPQVHQAINQTAALYHPDYTAMLDQDLIQSQFQLSPYTSRHALIVSVPFNTHNLEMGEPLIRNGRFKNRRDYTYPQVDRLVNSKVTTDRDTTTFKSAYTIAQSLRLWRYHLENKHPRPKRIANPAKFIVTEMMVLSNYLLAKFATDNQLPILYRNCIQTDNNVWRAYYWPELISHGPLKMAYYTHLTSQLRRAADLVNGLQYQEFLKHPEDPNYPFSNDDLFTLADHLNSYSPLNPAQ